MLYLFFAQSNSVPHEHCLIDNTLPLGAPFLFYVPYYKG